MLEKPRARYKHKGWPSLAGSSAQTVPTPGISEVGEQLQQIQAKAKENYVSTPVTCYPCKTHSWASGGPQPASGLCTSHEGPTMDGVPSHYLPFTHAAQKMLENTADCVQLLMQISGTQVGVSRNCSRPRETFTLGIKVA